MEAVNMTAGRGMFEHCPDPNRQRSRGDHRRLATSLARHGFQKPTVHKGGDRIVPETSNLERAIGIVLGKLDGIEDRLKHQDESRAKLYERLDALVHRTTNLESDLSAVKSKVEAHEKVTVEVTTLRSKAEGAGTLGRWLIRVGYVVLSAASGFAAAYTWLTGRPPP